MKDEYCLCHLVTATGDLLRARETSSVSRKDEEAIEKLQEMLQRQGTKLDKVLNFAADEAILEERITGRRIHPPSGTIYHSKFAPPKCMAALMMVTGEPLIQRKDYTPEALKLRLEHCTSKLNL